jgi:hypothetical protein
MLAGRNMGGRMNTRDGGAMSSQDARIDWSALGSGVLGMGAGLLVMSVWAGRFGPTAMDRRVAFIALAAITAAMCGLGMESAIGRLGATHWITLTGSTIGAVLAVLVVGVVAGWPLPLISNDRTAFMALGGLTFVKWILSWIGRLFYHARVEA